MCTGIFPLLVPEVWASTMKVSPVRELHIGCARWLLLRKDVVLKSVSSGSSSNPPQNCNDVMSDYQQFLSCSIVECFLACQPIV